MTAALKKGWCPSLRRPMESGDGWLVRLPIRFGILPAATARRIADLSRRHGNGLIDLTQRGNLQLRGVTAQSYDALLRDLDDIGLGQEPAIPLAVSPLAGLDPACADIVPIAESIEHWAANKNLILPPKFFCALDGGGALPLAIPADVHAAAPFHLPDILARIEAALTRPARSVAGQTGRPPAPGYLDLSAGSGAIAVAAPFGRLDAGQLDALADLAATQGDLRLAPWRMMFLPATQENHAAALAAAAGAGLVTQAGDARLHIHACPGAPACSSALGDTRHLAARLAQINLQGRSLHVSGCAKGCAHPAAADVAVVAGNGGYKIALTGRADAPPIATALSPDAVLTRVKAL